MWGYTSSITSDKPLYTPTACGYNPTSPSYSPPYNSDCNGPNGRIRIDSPGCVKTVVPIGVGVDAWATFMENHPHDKLYAMYQQALRDAKTGSSARVVALEQEVKERQIRGFKQEVELKQLKETIRQMTETARVLKERHSLEIKIQVKKVSELRKELDTLKSELAAVKKAKLKLAQWNLMITRQMRIVC